MSSSTSTSKRSRPNKKDEDDDDDGDDKNENSFPSVVQKLLKFDTAQLTSLDANYNIETLLVKLQEYCEQLQISVDTVNKERLAQEQERNDELRASIKAIEDKERTEWVTNKLCFECKKERNEIGGVSPCCGYKNDGEGVSGGGILACDDCYEKVSRGMCTGCNSYVCTGEGACNHGYCMGEGYNCKSCESFFCLQCYEDGDEGKDCQCDDWYCNSCNDDVYAERCCGDCNEINTFCDNCDYNQLKKCEGDCEKPLCDECVQKLECGNSVRLCGECNYDCADCDMCEYGY